MTPEWRKHATPEELAEHDNSITEGAAKRRLIRNRCRMRAKAKADKENNGE
jgi:hypothetical protein